MQERLWAKQERRPAWSRKGGCEALRESGLVSESPAAHRGFPVPELQVLAKVCAGQLERVEEARQARQLVDLSSPNLVAGEGESWAWLRSSLPTDVPTAGQHCRDSAPEPVPSSGVSGQLPISSITRKGKGSAGPQLLARGWELMRVEGGAVTGRVRPSAERHRATLQHSGPR